MISACILIFFIVSIIFQSGGFLKGLAPFANREVDQTNCAEAVYKAETSELIAGWVVEVRSNQSL